MRCHRRWLDTQVAAASGPFASHFQNPNVGGNSECFKNTTSTDFVMGAFDISICAWVKLDASLTGTGGILSLWDSNVAANRVFELAVVNVGGVMEAQFQVMGATAAVRRARSTVELNDGAWHFVAGWWDHTTGISSVQVDNGTVFTAAAAAITMTAIGPSTVPLRMGALDASGSMSAGFYGTLDSVGFWKSTAGNGGALSSGLRTSLYNSAAGKNFSQSVAGEQVALLSWWDLEAATSATQTDAIGTTNFSVDVNPPTQVAGKV
jgi:hypothetical protein